jgi:flagellar hook protein FlgE
VAPDGSVDANPSDLSRLSAINVKNIGATVRKSTEAQITANLNADQAVSAGLTTYNAATKSMAAYDPDAGTGTKPDFTVQLSVVDSKGASHTIAASFLKTNTANQWKAEIYAVPAADVTAGAGLAAGQIRAGTVAFNPDGSIDMSNTTLFASATDPSITLGASDAGAPAAGAVNWASGLGIEGQTLQFAIGQAGKGGLGQLADPSTVKTVSTNGAGVGEVTGVEISDDGFVSAVFDNGEVRKLAQIAVATFPNADGLKAVSGNAYVTSSGSGTFSLKRPGEGGAGDVAGSSLEASTVDLSSEFTGLITTQRAYSASSKIIMTADQMMEELLSIKR